jgi:hypothetical protein
MAEQIEQRLSEVFREDAGRAPALGAGVPEQVVRMVRRRRARWGLAAGLTVAVLAVGIPMGLGMVSDEPAPPTAVGRSGALPDSGMADCMPPKSPAAVAARSVSFDGTVTAIVEDAQPADPSMRNATVTFKVSQWFRGGSGPTATAVMQAPLPRNFIASEAGPPYTVGTRLLVSGEAIGGQGSGRLQAFSCGYTRYYDEETAAAWRQAVRGG